MNDMLDAIEEFSKVVLSIKNEATQSSSQLKDLR